MQKLENSIKVFLPPPHTISGVLYINGEHIPGEEVPNGFRFYISMVKTSRPNITEPYLIWTLRNGETVTEGLGLHNLFIPEDPEVVWEVAGNVLTVYVPNFTFESDMPLMRQSTSNKTYFVNITDWPIEVTLNHGTVRIPPALIKNEDVLKRKNHLLVLYMEEDLDLEQYDTMVDTFQIDLNNNKLISLPPLSKDCFIYIKNAIIEAPINIMDDETLYLENCIINAPLFTDFGTSTELKLCTINNEETDICGKLEIHGCKYNIETDQNPELLNSFVKGSTYYEQMKGWVFKDGKSGTP